MKIRTTIHSGRKQRGMSLLEMVCTVSIMGGLSATALPHFADLPGDARKSVVMSMQGAMTSASTLMHMKCATQAGCPLHEGSALVAISDTTVAMSRGYPQGGAPAGIQNALQFSGFNPVHVGDKTVFQKEGAPDAAACSVSYVSPQVDGGLPVITADVSGC